MHLSQNFNMSGENSESDHAVETEASNSSDEDDILNLNDVTEDERLKIREKISNLSFEDLLKMKDEMGSKLYNKTVLGVAHNKPRSAFKRANKNRPREMSSKIKPKQARKELQHVNDGARKKQITPRDPRFDPLCGQFDPKTFKSNYKFVNEIKIKEKKQLEKELKICTDPDRQKNINYLLQRMNNQIREEEKRNKEEQKIFEEKKEIKEKLKKGEKPIFKKKSVKKLENLIEKYESLKKTNRLQKHIQKRTKKLSAKDKKKMSMPDVP